MADDNFDEPEEAFLDEKDIVSEIILEGDEPVIEDGSDSEDEGDASFQVVKDAVASDKPFRDLVLHTDAVYATAFNDAKEGMCCTGGGDELVALWDIIDDTSEPFKVSTHTDSINSMAFSNDGKFLASGGLDGKIVLINTNEKTSTTVELEESVECMTWHAKGNVVFAGTEDGTGFLINAEKSKVMKHYFGHADTITKALFSTNGKRIITCSLDATIKVWKPMEAECVHTIRGHLFNKAPIVSMMRYPDQNVFVTGDTDGGIALSNAQTGKALGKLPLHKAAVEGLCSLSGPLGGIASCSTDGIVAVWDLNTKSLRRQIQKEGPAANHIFSHPNQALLLTSHVSGSVHMWDTRLEDACVRTWQCSTMPIFSMSVRKDWKAFIIGAEDNRSAVYLMETDQTF